MLQASWRMLTQVKAGLYSYLFIISLFTLLELTVNCYAKTPSLGCSVARNVGSMGLIISTELSNFFQTRISIYSPNRTVFLLGARNEVDNTLRLLNKFIQHNNRISNSIMASDAKTWSFSAYSKCKALWIKRNQIKTLRR